ncbi:PH-like domain-containing protein [Gordonia crocea]|uniref:PH domain-containing protein n=1 Tax=Gordonia crocea TaxID=589162 RepID=A0A7I9UYM1_9ACTN|nr:transporter [Gordonia crocea]GED97900.1 hypothetical protein nbrc107697_19390 [Gordonia crocea]
MSTGTLVVNIVFLAGVAAFLVFIGWLLWLVITGSSRRGREQAEVFGEFPAAPAEFGELVVGPTPGLYVGTTPTQGWIQRIHIDDLGDRAAASATGYTHGVAIERHGASTVWIPHDALISVHTTARAAGKVVHSGGLLAFDWRLPSGVEITSALRADDKDDYPHWLAAYPGTTETTDPEAAE